MQPGLLVTWAAAGRADQMHLGLLVTVLGMQQWLLLAGLFRCSRDWG
jgi:hypothetical protein